MAKINTYGIKMVGIKKACGNTQSYKHNDWHNDIYYNKETGEVWTVFHRDRNERTVYHDAAIVRVGITARHLKMQEIADMIALSLGKLIADDPEMYC